MTERKQLIVINSPSSQCDDANVKVMLVACATLMTHVCNLWEKSGNADLLLRSEMRANNIPQSRDSIRIILVSTSEEAHVSLEDEKNEGGNVIVIVPTKQIFSNGGSILGSRGEPSVAAALFQAVCDLIINPSGNIWWNDYISGEFISGIICGPVEGEPVTVTVTISSPETVRDEPIEDSSTSDDTNLPKLEDIAENNQLKSSDQKENLSVVQKELTTVNVTLCNFVLPAWFDPTSPANTRLDFLGTIKEPFQVSSSGYCIKFTQTSGSIPQIVFGRKVSVWKREQIHNRCIFQWDDNRHLSDQNTNA